MERWSGGAVGWWWSGGAVERWGGGVVERWSGGTVGRWSSGEAWWFGGVKMKWGWLVLVTIAVDSWVQAHCLQEGPRCLGRQTIRCRGNGKSRQDERDLDRLELWGLGRGGAAAHLSRLDRGGR